MTKLERLLSQYAAYHLNHKNILTHFIGIPFIVFSILCLTARVGFIGVGIELTLALGLIVVTSIYYLSLDRIFAFIMLVILLAMYPLALKIAHLDWMLWLSLSIGIFVVGWLFQFVGHFYEKKKPAFTDDIIGLAIGPLFVLAEMIFMLGFRKNLEERILAQARILRADMESKQIRASLH
ncbi:MAG: Mpo1-like protein [Acinetobacter sp.]|uniref:Mpo1 family 2-hydroxy fatty acid dioxygenase n=1 Tax=Acinetobacter sp. TaxID=472 RepID=UPI003981B965